MFHQLCSSSFNLKYPIVVSQQPVLLEYNDITHIDRNNLIQTPTQAFEQDTYTGHTRYCIESGVENLQGTMGHYLRSVWEQLANCQRSINSIPAHFVNYTISLAYILNTFGSVILFNKYHLILFQHTHRVFHRLFILTLRLNSNMYNTNQVNNFRIRYWIAVGSSWNSHVYLLIRKYHRSTDREILYPRSNVVDRRKKHLWTRVREL